MEGVKAGENKLAVFENVITTKEKRYFGNSFVEDSLTPSESDLIIDDEYEPPVKRKRGKKPVKYSEEPLNLICLWDSCGETYNNYKKFVFHLRDHITNLYGENNDNSGKAYECKWTDCTDVLSTSLLLIQHLTYHGYHTKLKNIGQNVLLRSSLPECNMPVNVTIPVEENGYTCDWEDCGVCLGTVFDFYQHMEIHIKNNPTYCKKDEIIECNWKDCTRKFLSQYKLSEHVRSHTKEKFVACPTCGVMFTTKTKFSDHRRRQLAIELQSYQCSQCSKLFPSERLLRDHIRSHINHYKCSMCDMTCQKPSLLALHIRHRHLNDRPYKCNLCDHACVSKQNLEYHLVTHCAEKLMACDQCSFKCRSMHGLDKHYEKKHGQRWAQTYECHCCKRLFSRGGFLTQHLMRKHNFHWPSGHSRFRYKEDPDGIFRLQTVRYESLEVTEQIIKEKTNPKTPVTPKRYKCTLQQKQGVKKGPIYNFVIQTDENPPEHTDEGDPDNPKEIDETIENSSSNNIVITIDDVDESGNILKTEVIQSKTIVYENGLVATPEGTLFNMIDDKNSKENYENAIHLYANSEIDSRDSIENNLINDEISSDSFRHKADSKDSVLKKSKESCS